MNRTITLAAMALGMYVVLPGAAFAQTAKDLVGTWANVSNVSVRPDGSKADIFGPKGTGTAIFGSNGRFAIININPDTPKFASNNRAQGTPEENKAAVLGAIALYGTYSVANKVIAFKVEGSSFPNWTGTEQKRTIKSFTKDQFTWTLPASIGGTAEVTWKRMK
jgi:lipocalin-like protein